MKNIEFLKENDLVKFCFDHKESAKLLLKSTKQTFGLAFEILSHFILPIADNIAKKWLKETNNPYLDEIEQYAKILGFPGVYALNLSYEWGCSSGIFNTSTSPDILRILDWPFKGLGENIFILQQSKQAGIYYNISWPAVSGVFQGTAPGRFSAAINQAPMRQHGLTYFGDWLKNRQILKKQKTLPPAHLLRQVFETAKNYDEAKELLIETPISMPVIYILSGVNKNEGCVIERLEEKASIRELKSENKQVSITNHFQTDLTKYGKSWKSRAIDSCSRADQLNKLDYPGFKSKDFNWLSFPMLNELTRLCMIANAKDGSLMIQGFEKDGPVTNIFML